MILGAQKAGTTSLYEYMVNHPLIVRADDAKRTAWTGGGMINAKQQRVEGNGVTSFTTRTTCNFIPASLTNSTPSYLLDSRRVIPDCKCSMEDEVHCHAAKSDAPSLITPW
jgi:hypothetical protein